jgi:hypothetical protein
MYFRAIEMDHDDQNTMIHSEGAVGAPPPPPPPSTTKHNKQNNKQHVRKHFSTTLSFHRVLSSIT